MIELQAILVVEDDALVLMDIAEQLQAEGFKSMKQATPTGPSSFSFSISTSGCCLPTSTCRALWMV